MVTAGVLGGRSADVRKEVVLVGWCGDHSWFFFFFLLFSICRFQKMV